jgi:predicted nucleic acid-binding protein
MADRTRVLDASVAAKCFIEEEGSDEARRRVLGELEWIAPDLIFLEVASVAMKAVRKNAIGIDGARQAVGALGQLLAETISGRVLCERAFQLAAEHGFSAYDAAYLALAQREGCRLLTADRRLVERAHAVGLGEFVELLKPT